MFDIQPVMDLSEILLDSELNSLESLFLLSHSTRRRSFEEAVFEYGLARYVGSVKDNMRNEKTRLKSFTSAWDKEKLPCPKEMAAAGLFFIEVEDRVSTFFIIFVFLIIKSNRTDFLGWMFLLWSYNKKLAQS